MKVTSAANDPPVAKSLVGFTAARSGEAFVIHIVDDEAEVFEVEASRENLELIVMNLQSLLTETQPGPPELDRGTDEAAL